MEELVSGSSVFYGKPKIEVQAGRKIVITAEPSETECDRASAIVDEHDGIYLDFSDEVCFYRQIEREEAGYFFEILRRSEGSSSFDFMFKIRRGSVLFDDLQLKSMNFPGQLHSSPARWFGTPALEMDRLTRMISIRPSGDTDWEYSHEWDTSQIRQAILSFAILPKRLSTLRGLALTNPVWLFTEAVAGLQGQGEFTIVKDRWLVREDNGDFTMTFEDIEGSIFGGPRQGVFIGRPEISFVGSDDLLVRSNGDARILCDVEIRESPGRMEIVFKINDYRAVGSVPVEAGPADDPCPICMEEYAHGSMLAETRCKHRFHIGCLGRVVERRCPLCRGSLDLW